MPSSWVPGLDRLLGGGLRPASLCLVRGGPGSGRTSLALQFALGAALAGETAVLVCLEDDRARLEATARSLGLPWERPLRRGRLRLVNTSGPVLDADLKAMPGMLELLVMESGARRLAVDGLAALTAGQGLDRLGALGLRGALTRHGLTALVTADGDAPETAALAHVADCLITLEVELGRGGARRLLAVDKQRGSACRPGRFLLELGQGGVRLAGASPGVRVVRPPGPAGSGGAASGPWAHPRPAPGGPGRGGN
jgi:circadian clock protein KaiC